MMAQHLILFSFGLGELSVHVTKYSTPSVITTLHATLWLMSISAPHVGRISMKILINIENAYMQEI